MRSCNVYISQKVCYPFAEYTAITNNFLEENGIPLNDAKEWIDKYKDRYTIKIMHGDEVHAVVNDLEEDV